MIGFDFQRHVRLALPLDYNNWIVVISNGYERV